MFNILDQDIISLSKINNYESIQSLKIKLSIPDTNLSINVPCPNLTEPHWNLDIADDYLVSLFVGETLAQYCENIRVDFENLRTVYFTFNTKYIINLEKFKENLIWFGKIFDSESSETDEESDNSWDEFYEETQDFAEKLQNLNLNFPDLGDKYMANLIPGEEQVLNEEELDVVYFKNPEWRYEFWRSFSSNDLSFDLYMSSWAWIIPHDLNSQNVRKNLESALTKVGGFSDGIPNLEPAQVITLNNLPSIVFNENIMSCYPSKGLGEARKCSMSIWDRRLQYKSEYINHEAARLVFNIVNHGLDLVNDKVDVKLSEDGYILVVSDSLAQYIFFREEDRSYKYWTQSEDEESTFFEEISNRGEMTLWEVPSRGQSPFWKALDKFSEILCRFEGNPTNIKWSDFDDEKFEHLCYDIIRMSERFNPDTARKMGNSRSRDGGRDIEIYTRTRLNFPEKKWIIQCKFSKGDKALAGSKVSISDVIDEYNVQGFCVMTNTLIDSTLHDKLERIAQTRHIEFDEWDILRIERTLSRPRYRNIKKRYFKE